MPVLGSASPSVPMPAGPTTDRYATGVEPSVGAPIDALPGDLPDAPRRPPPGPFLTEEPLARAEALRLRRPLLVVFAAEWCVPCRLIEADVLSDERVLAMLAGGFVSLHLDVTEETMANREVLARYRVRGVPALVVLGPGGRELDRIEGYLDADAFLERLRRARARSSE